MIITYNILLQRMGDHAQISFILTWSLQNEFWATFQEVENYFRLFLQLLCEEENWQGIWNVRSNSSTYHSKQGTRLTHIIPFIYPQSQQPKARNFDAQYVALDKKPVCAQRCSMNNKTINNQINNLAKLSQHQHPTHVASTTLWQLE